MRDDDPDVWRLHGLALEAASCLETVIQERDKLERKLAKVRGERDRAQRRVDQSSESAVDPPHLRDPLVETRRPARSPLPAHGPLLDRHHSRRLRSPGHVGRAPGLGSDGGAMRESYLVGLPVEVDKAMPPGIVKLVTPQGDEYLAGIGVPWIYEALTTAPPYQRARSHWVTRSEKDLIDKLGPPPKSPDSEDDKPA